MNLNSDARATECSFVNSSSIAIVASYVSRSFPLEILSEQLVELTTEEFNGKKERNWNLLKTVFERIDDLKDPNTDGGKKQEEEAGMRWRWDFKNRSVIWPFALYE